MKLTASDAFWVAAEIGLDTMRTPCPRFRAWLETWKAWGMALCGMCALLSNALFREPTRVFLVLAGQKTGRLYVDVLDALS